MVSELVIGSLTHSVALRADGWHMGTHVGALGLTLPILEKSAKSACGRSAASATVSGSLMFNCMVEKYHLSTLRCA